MSLLHLLDECSEMELREIDLYLSTLLASDILRCSQHRKSLREPSATASAPPPHPPIPHQSVAPSVARA